MTKGLKIRIITSVILFLLTIFCIFIHPYIFMVAVIIISYLLYTNYYDLVYWTDNVLLIAVILISSISQIGDLTVSYFKRISKIKNTGKIIPGHGGLSDRIDGMLFAIPFAFILFKFL